MVIPERKKRENKTIKVFKPETPEPSPERSNTEVGKKNVQVYESTPQQPLDPQTIQATSNQVKNSSQSNDAASQQGSDFEHKEKSSPTPNPAKTADKLDSVNQIDSMNPFAEQKL